MPAIAIHSPHGDVPAWLERPDGPGPYPGVVVLHDALGMSHDLKGQCRWLASAGYLAIAPDLYHWGSLGKCLRHTIRDVLKREGRSFDEIEAARRHLAHDADCTGRIGVIGFCLGGGFAMLLVPPDKGFSAASVNYGAVPKDIDDLLVGACPVIGSYGAMDSGLKTDALRLEAALAKTDIPHDVQVYADTDHAFMNDHAEDEAPWGLTLLGVVLGSAGGFHPESAAHARGRIERFFDAHLKAAPAG